MAPPDFGRSVNPISTREGGTDYAHLITTGTPGSSDLPTALPCLSKSWTQLFLKWPNYRYLVGNGSWSPISMLDLRPNKQASKQTNKQANLEEEKYQMKSHPALNIELKKKKKLVKLKWPEVENWNRKSETTNWLRLRSHHTSVQKLSTAILCRFVHTRWKFIQIQTQQVRNFSHFSAIRCCPPTIKIWPFFKTNFYFFCQFWKTINAHVSLLQKQKLKFMEELFF